MADWLDDPEEDGEDTSGVASALADPRGTFADSKGAVPSATPQIHEGSPAEAHNADDSETDNGDYETSSLANPTPAEQQDGNGGGKDEDMAPFLGYDNKGTETPGPASATLAASATGAPAASGAAGGAEDADPYADFHPQAPQVPQAPQLPSAEDARDQLAHQIASFNPDAYKPSQGRRIGAAIAAGMASFGHVPGAEHMAQDIENAPLNRARAVEDQKERGLNQQIANTEANRGDAQQDYQNRVSDYNMQERGMTNAARVADWQALAQQRKAVAQQKLTQVDPRTLGPVDPNNPFGEWQGKNAQGNVIRGLEPPPAVQKDPRYAMQQRRSQLQQMTQDGIKLTPQESKFFLINGKLAEPSQHTTISIRENPDGSPVQPGRGGAGGGMSKSLHDRIINEKNTAMTKAQQQHASGVMSDGEYQQALQDAQDNFEQRVEEATGQPQAHMTVNDKFQFAGADGKAIPPSNSGAQPAAAPAQAAASPQNPAAPAQQPQGRPLVKAGNGQELTDKSLAAQYLQKAGGDKGKARALASKDGWKF